VGRRSPLSAEPLVGLKLALADDRRSTVVTFSRTPRGFEAHTARTTVETKALSAEPLVGLKRLG